MKLLRSLSRGVLAVVVGLAATMVASSPAAGQSMSNPKPLTIPALQEWSGGTGSFTFTGATRIVWSRTYAPTLASTSQVFADDLLALTGRPVTRFAGTVADLRPGDIFLTLGSTDSGLGAEGYALSITDKITITARDERGAFYGTRTVLQLLKQSTRSRRAPRGTGRSSPSAD
ncbi:glycoside hydrolase family 20 zincin-like fold domain-containing protein [Kribbella sp. NPDC050820]|uniref:glycoside hydrolase family 20 zincin-like fold domain-containing protein n=1 Tax=Kribbella sp. NPDC050820 TaxID=3155408 RepID=UPI0033DE6CEE